MVSRRQHSSTSSSSPGAGLAVLDVGRQDPLDRQLGRTLLGEHVEHVGRPLAEDAAQPGQQRVGLAGVRRAAPVPAVERLVGGGGQVGVVALVHRDPVAVAGEQQRGQHAGHATADDGDVLRVGGRFGERSSTTPREEVDQRLVDLVGPLLLGPVAASLEDDRAVQLRQRRARTRRSPAPPQMVGPSRSPPMNSAGTSIAGTAPRGEILPVAVDVAVPVERPAEAGVLELARVHVEVGLGQPVGQRVGLVEAVLHLRAVGDRGDGARRPGRAAGRRPTR